MIKKFIKTIKSRKRKSKQLLKKKYKWPSRSNIRFKIDKTYIQWTNITPMNQSNKWKNLVVPQISKFLLNKQNKKFKNIYNILWQSRLFWYNYNKNLKFLKFIKKKLFGNRNSYLFNLHQKRIKLIKNYNLYNKLWDWFNHYNVKSLLLNTKRVYKKYIFKYTWRYYRYIIQYLVHKYCNKIIYENKKNINIKDVIKKLKQSIVSQRINWNNNRNGINYQNLSFIYFINNYNNLLKANVVCDILLTSKKNLGIVENKYNNIEMILYYSLYKKLLDKNIIRDRLKYWTKNLHAIKRKRKIVSLNEFFRVYYKHKWQGHIINMYKLNFGKSFFYTNHRFNLFSYFLFNKLQNRYMFRGQRFLINNIFSNVLIQYKYKLLINFQQTIKIILSIIRPFFNFIYRRKAKKTFAVPVPIQWHQQYKIAIKWIYWTVAVNIEKSLELKLLKEFAHILMKKKNVLIKRRNLFYHNVVENRFYTNFRWK